MKAFKLVPNNRDIVSVQGPTLMQTQVMKLEERSQLNHSKQSNHAEKNKSITIPPLDQMSQGPADPKENMTKTTKNDDSENQAGQQKGMMASAYDKHGVAQKVVQGLNQGSSIKRSNLHVKHNNSPARIQSNQFSPQTSVRRRKKPEAKPNQAYFQHMLSPRQASRQQEILQQNALQKQMQKKLFNQKQLMQTQHSPPLNASFSSAEDNFVFGVRNLSVVQSGQTVRTLTNEKENEQQEIKSIYETLRFHQQQVEDELGLSPQQRPSDQKVPHLKLNEMEVDKASLTQQPHSGVPSSSLENDISQTIMRPVHLKPNEFPQKSATKRLSILNPPTPGIVIEQGVLQNNERKNELFDPKPQFKTYNQATMPAQTLQAQTQNSGKSNKEFDSSNHLHVKNMQLNIDEILSQDEKSFQDSASNKPPTEQQSKESLSIKKMNTDETVQSLQKSAGSPAHRALPQPRMSIFSQKIEQQMNARDDTSQPKDQLFQIERGDKTRNQFITKTAGSNSSEERTENECTARFSEAGGSSEVRGAKMSRYSKMETSRMTLDNQHELANLLKRQSNHLQQKLSYEQGRRTITFNTAKRIELRLNIGHQPNQIRIKNENPRPTNINHIQFDSIPQTKRQPNLDQTKKLLKQKVNFANEKAQNKYMSMPQSPKESHRFHKFGSPIQQFQPKVPKLNTHTHSLSPNDSQMITFRANSPPKLDESKMPQPSLVVDMVQRCVMSQKGNRVKDHAEKRRLIFSQDQKHRAKPSDDGFFSARRGMQTIQADPQINFLKSQRDPQIRSDSEKISDKYVGPLSHRYQPGGAANDFVQGSLNYSQKQINKTPRVGNILLTNKGMVKTNMPAKTQERNTSTKMNNDPSKINSYLDAMKYQNQCKQIAIHAKKYKVVAQQEQKSPNRYLTEYDTDRINEACIFEENGINRSTLGEGSNFVLKSQRTQLAQSLLNSTMTDHVSRNYVISKSPIKSLKTAGKVTQKRLQDKQQYNKEYFMRYLQTQILEKAPDGVGAAESNEWTEQSTQTPEFDLNHIPHNVKVDGFFKQMQKNVEDCLNTLQVLKLKREQLKQQLTESLQQQELRKSCHAGQIMSIKKMTLDRGFNVRVNDNPHQLQKDIKKELQFKIDHIKDLKELLMQLYNLQNLWLIIQLEKIRKTVDTQNGANQGTTQSHGSGVDYQNLQEQLRQNYEELIKNNEILIYTDNEGTPKSNQSVSKSERASGVQQNNDTQRLGVTRRESDGASLTPVNGKNETRTATPSGNQVQPSSEKQGDSFQFRNKNLMLTVYSKANPIDDDAKSQNSKERNTTKQSFIANIPKLQVQPGIDQIDKDSRVLNSKDPKRDKSMLQLSTREKCSDLGSAKKQSFAMFSVITPNKAARNLSPLSVTSFERQQVYAHDQDNKMNTEPDEEQKKVEEEQKKMDNEEQPMTPESIINIRECSLRESTDGNPEQLQQSPTMVESLLQQYSPDHHIEQINIQENNLAADVVTMSNITKISYNVTDQSTPIKNQSEFLNTQTFHQESNQPIVQRAHGIDLKNDTITHPTPESNNFEYRNTSIDMFHESLLHQQSLIKSSAPFPESFVPTSIKPKVYDVETHQAKMDSFKLANQLQPEVNNSFTTKLGLQNRKYINQVYRTIQVQESPRSGHFVHGLPQQFKQQILGKKIVAKNSCAVRGSQIRTEKPQEVKINLSKSKKMYRTNSVSNRSPQSSQMNSPSIRTRQNLNSDLLEESSFNISPTAKRQILRFHQNVKIQHYPHQDKNMRINSYDTKYSKS